MSKSKKSDKNEVVKKWLQEEPDTIRIYKKVQRSFDDNRNKQRKK